MRNDLLLGGGIGGVGGPLGAEWRATHDMTRGPLSATHLTDRTPEEIRRLAGARGYEPHGLPDAKDNPIRDPATGDKHFPFR